MLKEDERDQSAESYLLMLVRAVRDDEREEEQSNRDLYVRARKRRRRLGLIAFGAGPMAGAANRVSDLYCEVATFCDVADFHALELSDEQIAAHMLVLWSIVEDFPRAESVMRGEPPLVEVLKGKLSESLGLNLEVESTKASIAKGIWEIHRLNAADAVAGAKEMAKGQRIRSVAFAGHHVKKVIGKAEAQLGVSSRASRGWRW
jgi:hypothetical protein